MNALPTFTVPDSGGILAGRCFSAAGRLRTLFDTAAAPTYVQNRLLGRGAASGTGIAEAITLGAGLSLTGTVLASTGGGGTSYTAPALADFTFYNQGGATVATPSVSAFGGIHLTAPALASANAVTVLAKAVTVPYTLVAAYWSNCGLGAATFGLIGPCLFDTASTKIYQMRYGSRDTGSGQVVLIQKFSDHTTPAGTVAGPFGTADVTGENGALWVKLTDDGADRKFYVGSNPDAMTLIYTEASGTYLTPNRIGFAVNPFSEFVGLTCFHYVLT